MKTYAVVAATAVTFAAAGAAWLDPATISAVPEVAAQAETGHTVRLAIDNLYCAACRITVRTAIQRVEGVASVTVDRATGTATVVFDPSVTSVEAIAAASADIGFPAQPQGAEARP